VAAIIYKRANNRAKLQKTARPGDEIKKPVKPAGNNWFEQHPCLVRVFLSYGMKKNFRF